MAFENLTDKLADVFKKMSGNDVISEKNIEQSLIEIRKALLEADVNYRVVKDFLAKVKEEAIGQGVIKAVKPDEMIIKIIHDELAKLLGSEYDTSIQLRDSGITTLMLVGLQGTGKTTNLAKIVKLLKNKNTHLKPLIIAADVIRPGAILQLQTLANQINVDVFSLGEEVFALETVKQGYKHAKEQGYNLVVIDTAGRLQIAEELMEELVDIKSFTNPDEILLTVDAMSGQDIISVAKEFNERLTITGLIISKMDSDTRGGSVLSVTSMAKVPVKFVGVGEKMDDLDIFYPDRMADRILGMGDVVSLVEKAQEKLDAKLAEKTVNRLAAGKFDFEDMLAQFDQMNKLGSLKGIMKMIPGINKMVNDFDEDDANKNMEKSKAIIYSMTIEERQNPDLIMASRKSRIAKGSGTEVADVNRLLKQFKKSKEQMRLLSKMMK